MPSSGETDKLPACSTVLKAISEAFMYGFCLKVPFSPQFQAVLCLKDFMLLCLHSSNVKVSLYCKLFSHTHFNPELFLVYTRVSAAVGLDIKCVFNLPAWCQIASMCDWGQGGGVRTGDLPASCILHPRQLAGLNHITQSSSSSEDTTEPDCADIFWHSCVETT